MISQESSRQQINIRGAVSWGREASRCHRGKRTTHRLTHPPLLSSPPQSAAPVPGLARRSHLWVHTHPVSLTLRKRISIGSRHFSRKVCIEHPSHGGTAKAASYSEIQVPCPWMIQEKKHFSPKEQSKLEAVKERKKKKKQFLVLWKLVEARPGGLCKPQWSRVCKGEFCRPIPEHMTGVTAKAPSREHHGRGGRKSSMMGRRAIKCWHGCAAQELSTAKVTHKSASRKDP